MPAWAKVLCAILIAAAVTAAMIPLNLFLATKQSFYAFWVNTALSGILILANLGLLWMSETRAAGSVPPGNALLASGALLVPAAAALTVALVKNVP
jgi:hypothetical protein